MMEGYRANPLKELAGSPVVLFKDYKTLRQVDDKGNVSDIDMPATSNVLQFFSADGSKVSIRPSGTEPKIKFYIEVKELMHSRGDYHEVNAKAEQKIERVKKSLGV